MSKPPALVVPDYLRLRQCRHGPMLYPKGDAYVGRSLELYGEYSEAEVDLFRFLIKPGDMVVEAGANLGSLTLPLARLVGPAGRVLAFEPQRSMHTLLCANAALNGLSNINAERMALGETDGTTTVPVAQWDASGNFGGIAVGEGKGEVCAQARIDSWGLQRLNFIKIDVEGAELGVINGGAETIRRLRPAMLVENDRRDRAAALISAITALGYECWWHLAPLFNPSNYDGKTENVFGRMVSINMLCLPEGAGIEVKGIPRVTSPDNYPL